MSSTRRPTRASAPSTTGARSMFSPECPPPATSTSTSRGYCDKKGTLGFERPVMPRSYTVVSGDTLGTLAARFFGDSTRGALIATASSINPGDTLTVGETLVIPDVDLTPLPVTNGRPRVDFVGALPYASEVFGVYRPLAGWFGQRNSGRMGDSPAAAPTAFSDRKSVAARHQSGSALLRGVLGSAADGAKGVLSPVGLVNLFREYFFEFDTFLGTPVGHLWISPG